MQQDVLTSLSPKFYPTESVHQQAIVKHFGRKLLREWTEHERTVLGRQNLYFVVFTNRCGSTYLTEILHQMGAGIHPRGELFNGDKVIRMTEKWGYETFNDYLFGIVKKHRQHRRVGFKIPIHQLFWLTRIGVLDVFGSVKIINSVRADLLGQAVSHYKARNTGQWHSMMEARESGPLGYSREEILRSLHVISNRRELLHYYCALHNPPRLDVLYEDVLEDPAREMRRLAAFLDYQDFDPAQVDLGAIGIQQQRNEENDQMKQAFMREFYMGDPGAPGAGG